MTKFGYYLSGVVFSLAFFSVKAFAHGGHDPRLKVAVSETEIRVETSLDVEAFMAFDTNNDGKLTVTEYETHSKEIAAWVDSNLQLIDENEKPLKAYFADAPIVDRDHLKKKSPIENIKILRRYKFDENPGALKLAVMFYDNSPELLYTRAGSLETLFKFDICVPAISEGKDMTCLSSL